MGDIEPICENCHWYNGAFFCIKFWKDVPYDGSCEEIETSGSMASAGDVVEEEIQGDDDE